MKFSFKHFFKLQLEAEIFDLYSLGKSPQEILETLRINFPWLIPSEFNEASVVGILENITKD